MLKYPLLVAFIYSLATSSVRLTQLWAS